MTRALVTERIRTFLFALIFSLMPYLCSLAKPPEFTNEGRAHPPPKIIRTCCAFGANLSVARIPFVKKTDIISLHEIGPHHFLGDKLENNGIIYTKHGGFIDLGHLRDYADWTAYLYNLIVSRPDKTENIVLNLDNEGGTKTIIIRPFDTSDDQQILDLAGSIAYELSVWHEIATWYGASYIPLIPERYSSFSPEDLYSNLLGVRLGIEAVKSDLPYDEAMTYLLKKQLDSLEAVTDYEETLSAMEQVENLWWTNKKALPAGKILLVRYLDTDDHLVPWLLPESEFTSVPFGLNKPDPSLSTFYDIEIVLHKRMKIQFPENETLTITQNDFPKLIAKIEEDIKNEFDKQSLNQNKGKKKRHL